MYRSQFKPITQTAHSARLFGCHCPVVSCCRYHVFSSTWFWCPFCVPAVQLVDIDERESFKKQCMVAFSDVATGAAFQWDSEVSNQSDKDAHVPNTTPTATYAHHHHMTRTTRRFYLSAYFCPERNLELTVHGCRSRASNSKLGPQIGFFGTLTWYHVVSVHYNRVSDVALCQVFLSRTNCLCDILGIMPRNDTTPNYVTGADRHKFQALGVRGWRWRWGVVRWRG